MLSRFTPLTRKTPLGSQTAIVRKAGLRPVSKKRAKAKRERKGTVVEFHMDRIAGLPCLVCDVMPVQVHHVTASIHGGRIGRTDKAVTPLCRRHHKIEFGPHESVERLSHRGFWERYGIDLLAEAHRLWRETVVLWAEAQGLTTADKLEAL
jgi:hypothetical protein